MTNTAIKLLSTSIAYADLSIP